MTPYSWQIPIVKKVTEALSTNRYAINASGTGSGKTVMALQSAKDLHTAGLCSHVLVIAPKVSLSQWKITARATGTDDIILACINPEKISKPTGCEYYHRESGWSLPINTLVIWDEPHKSASGVNSIATKAMAQLRTYPTVRLLAMSATLADSPLKLRAIGYWAKFHTFDKSGFYRWCRANGCRDEIVGNRSIFRFTRVKSEAINIMKRIRKAFGQSFVCLDLSEIPNFPDQTLEVLRVDLDSSDRNELKKAYSEMSDRMKSPAKSDLAEIGRCRERIEFAKAGAMADLAISHLGENRSVVIFCNYTSARERIFEKLVSLHIPAELIGQVYGGQKEDERQRDITEFQENRKHVMIVMTAAGGAALSLHDDRHERPRVSLITPSFNAAEVKQALGRIRRCNGTNVEQYFVLAANTVEDRVAIKMESKIENIDTLNDNDLIESLA